MCIRDRYGAVPQNLPSELQSPQRWLARSTRDCMGSTERAASQTRTRSREVREPRPRTAPRGWVANAHHQFRCSALDMNR
eukprot:12868951-Alexandrium_andersonii.AAC.1